MRRPPSISILLAFTLAARTAAAQPGHTDRPTETTSYAGYTLAADATSLALLVGGALSEGENGRDTGASNALFTAGALGAFFGSPIIHSIRGHRDRAMGSFGIRGVFASAGMYVGLIMAAGCEGLLCELDGIGPGVFGGLVVASLIDAAFLTTEIRERPPTWTPQVSASSEGARIGIAGTF
jgi:hypothetical protein